MRLVFLLINHQAVSLKEPVRYHDRSLSQTQLLPHAHDQHAINVLQRRRKQEQFLGKEWIFLENLAV